MMRHGKYDRLNKLFNLLVQPADIVVILGRLLVHFHRLYATIILCREHVEDQVRVLVHTDEIRGSELVWVDEADHWEKDCLEIRPDGECKIPDALKF